MRRLIYLAAAMGLASAPAAHAAWFMTVDNSGAISNTVTGINDSGALVGWYTDAGGVNHGFTSTVGGSPTQVDASGYAGTQLTGINNSAVIVSTLTDASNGTQGATGPSGVFNGPIVVPASISSGLPNTYATGINGAGTVVGYYVDSATAKTFGFTYNGTTFTSPLTNPNAPGGVTVPNGINSAGIIVGSYVGSSGFVGFSYDGSTYSDINDPFGTLGTWATGIDDNGEIVGYYVDGSGTTHGFIDNNGSFLTVDNPDGVGTSILGVNNMDQIVGDYTDAQGVQHGFVGFVPEPGTMALMGAGLASLAAARRRKRRAG